MSCFPSSWGITAQEAARPVCHFYKLPAELKLAVVSFLETKRDLYNFAQTCKCSEETVLQRLYSTINIQLPAEKGSAWSNGSYLVLREHVLRAVQGLSLSESVPVSTDFKRSKRRRSAAASLESYVIHMVEQIPVNRLNSFSYMHRCALPSRLLSSLTAKHGSSLNQLSCYALNAAELPLSGYPQQLRVLECRSVDDVKVLRGMLEASKDTLQSVTIGQERELVERYHKLRTAFYDNIPQPLRELQSNFSLSEILNLRNLSLIGIDVSSIVPTGIEQALWLTKLDELTLESCLGSAELLVSMASVFEFVQSAAAANLSTTPRLRKFSIRHEATSAILKESLTRFLASFSGLQFLSMLFENGSMALRLADIASNHGATLKQLVLETRIQPRELLRLDTSRPFGVGGSQQLWEESIGDICRLCPNLEELSTGFPWADEIIRLRRSSLQDLRRLHTMHIRNFPESSTLLQMGDGSIREHAVRFLDWTFGKVIGGEKPALEVLAIGPTLYESRFPGSNPARKQPPEFLRTHYFLVEWAQTRFKRWAAMLEPVSEKYMEEMRRERPLKGVFQQVWLN